MRIGILGGTFDPIHLGHLAAARAAMDCERLDRVLFIPTGIPPHRAGTVADGNERVEMCRLAIAGETHFEVSDIEVQRNDVSYTVDTLRELKRLHPGDELFLILGWDAAKLFATWHEPAEVRRLASVVVVTRPGGSVTIQDLTTFARAHLAGYKAPRSMTFADELPKTGSGKILKRALREPYWRGRTTRVG